MTSQKKNNTVVDKSTHGEDLLHDGRLSRIVEEAVLEDIGMGDITTDAIISPETIGQGEIIFKESGIIAGLEVASLVFNIVDPEMVFTAKFSDGEKVSLNSVVATIDGSLSSILKAERTALNFIQRMSGIATLTHKFVHAVQGTRAKITDTRKTAPGLRILDKLAVQLGGGVNHRFGLDDMVLIKDNHIAAAGGIAQAIEQCLSHLRANGVSIKIEVETASLDDVREAVKHKGIHRIMLDNFSLEDTKKAVQLVRRNSESAGGLVNGAIELEASGNVSLENVRHIAETGVDYISVGALTHSPKALDISLEVTLRDKRS